jgi:threonine/homoserine/homoserine lactone efflux protein
MMIDIAHYFPSYMPAVGLILAGLLVGVLSPGPSFVQVARISVAQSRGAGLWASLGMGLAAALIAVLALAGLNAVFQAMPVLYAALKLLGGAYLIYIAYKIWCGANEPLSISVGASDAGSTHQKSSARYFWVGMITQLSNPKCAVIYGSVFAAFLPAHFPWIAGLWVVLGVFVMETGWYCITALVLSSAAPRSAYLRFKSKIDRTAAAVMGFMGVRLISTANSQAL